ncbi:MAG: hypothetical protein GX308_00935 [Epulopiscium sp.]|nr:hypothetical protein [Candidatus Epulonipiscium sp.]
MAKNQSSYNIKWILIIILFSCILILSSVFITITVIYPSLSPFSQKEKGISIKKMYASIQSSDGENHSLAVDFYITVSQPNITESQIKELESSILSIIPTLDYNNITKKDGTNYFIESIKKELRNTPSGNFIDEIYVSNFILDITISNGKSKRDNTDNFGEMFKSR